jgi:hypothetical protein
MKLTNEQRQRIAEAMGLVVEGERARDSHIATLAAGMRELAAIAQKDFDSADSPAVALGCGIACDVLTVVADDLEAK